MESFCLNFPLTNGTKRKYADTPSNSWAKMKCVPFYYTLRVWDVNLSPNHKDVYGQARNRPEMTFWWIAKCGLDWLSLHVITWRTCQNPVRKPPTVLTVSFSGGNLSVDFTFSFQPRTKSSHKFVWLAATKQMKRFLFFQCFVNSLFWSFKRTITTRTVKQEEPKMNKRTLGLKKHDVLC